MPPVTGTNGAGSGQPAPAGFGVFGNSDTGPGVVGFSNTGPGLQATSVSDFTGLFQSATGPGLASFTNGPGQAAVAGINEGQPGTGVYGNGNTGVFGYSSIGPGAMGVAGQCSADWGAGVMGEVFGNGYAIYGLSNNSWAGLFEGNVLMGGKVFIYGTLTKPGGSFRIDHPLDPRNKYLSHSFVESPDMLNIYNGLVQLDDHGAAVVELPEWFDALNREFRYQLTPIGAPAPNLHVAREIEKRAFHIGGGTAKGKVSWQVTGIRQDKWANANRIQVEEDKSYADRDRYLHPELFGESKDKTIMPGPRPKLTPPDKRPAHRPTVP